MYYLELQQPSAKTAQFLCKIQESDQQQILYINSVSSRVLSVSLYQQSLIVRQNSIDDEFSQEVRSQVGKQMPQNIVYGFFNSGDVFLVTQSPFNLYFITQGSPIVALKLQIQINLLQSVYALKQNALFIFGWNPNCQKNQIFQLNLQTLTIKNIDHSKIYGPESRTRYAAMIIDDRLYMFAGCNKKGQQCDKINWVYDLEKGSWFGLQMNYPECIGQKKPWISQWNSRKAIIGVEGVDKIWVFQLHQSKIKQVNGAIDLKNIQNCHKTVLFLNEEMVEVTDRKIRHLNKKIQYRKQKI